MPSPLAASILTFAAAAALLTVTPGLDTALVLRTAAVGGRRRAFGAAHGIGLGCLVWGAVAAVGLGALLAASELAYRAMKWVGAGYLLWLGVKLIRSPRSALESGEPIADGSAIAWIRRGMLTNALNPKVGIFYVSFLPQFIPPGANVPAMTLLLAAIHVALGLVWFTLLIAATAPLGRALRRPRVVRTLDRATGGIFMLFGAKLAFDRS